VYTFGLLLVGIRPFFAHLPCDEADAICSGMWRFSPAELRALDRFGVPIDVLAVAIIGLQAGSAGLWAAVGGAIIWRRPRERMAELTAYFLLVSGALLANGLLDATAGGGPVWGAAVLALRLVGLSALWLFPCVFPNGRFVPSWIRWPALGWTMLSLLTALAPGSTLDLETWPRWLLVGLLLAYTGTVVFGQVWRYRRVSDAVERQQTKWVVVGVGVALVGGFGTVGVSYLVFPDSLGHLLVGFVAFRAFQLLIPLSIGTAVLRHRLWDIELIVNRTLVYGGLTATVVGLYVLVVGYFAVFFQVRDSPVVALLATGLVAVLFQPLRQRLQRGANRVLYGQRDEPYLVLSRLGQRLEGTLVPDAVLPTIVQTVAEALKLPYAAIAVRHDQSFEIVAAHGAAPPVPQRWPLVYQQDTIGELLLGPRSPGETFGASDRRLLDDLARHAGIAAHGVRLTRDLQRLAADLQQARARLVATREEERRRLRRDLHDGLGPTLASLVQRLDLATRLVPRDPEAAVELLTNLKIQAKDTVGEIRQLVYGLRPPALDELGLVSAIREYAEQQVEPAGLAILVEAPSACPPLPAAVEVAAYRIVLEALTNVARHADADNCRIRLGFGPELLIEVVDDGRGVTQGSGNGVGLASMRERAAELGGECVVERGPAGGTRVRARLPLVPGAAEG
jgi:signal transduction histidine kinase